MAVRKLALISGSLAAVGVASFVGLGVASAQGQSGQDSIITKMSQKFNLNKDEVQKVFEEDRTARQAEHQAETKARLDQAVTDGKITAEQRTNLQAKLDEMHANRPDMKNMTVEQRQVARTAMETKRTEFEAWLKANNIPADLVQQGGPRGADVREGGGGRMMKNQTTDTTR